jgi:hypothetical protein
MMEAHRQVRGAMSFKLSAAIALVGLVGVSSAMGAQKAKTPTLDEILQRLEANLNHYDTALPNLFCDEHVISRIEPDFGHDDAVIDSVFRLKRTANPDHTASLVESREVKKVNGEPSTSKRTKVPALLSGVFEGGFAVVSMSQKACMKYTLERIHQGEPYVIRFATALTPENKAGCLLQEKGSGRVIIDPASMEITHLELTTPHHVINPGELFMPPVVGKWILKVDYARVVLDGDSFWMPSAIASRDVGKEGFNVTVWSFEAAYRNYHRLEVKSRILPGGEEGGP